MALIDFELPHRGSDPEGLYSISLSLHLVEGTSTDDLQDADGVKTPRYFLTAVPRLDIVVHRESCDQAADAVLYSQAQALGALEVQDQDFSYPLHVQVSRRASFELRTGGLLLNAPGLLAEQVLAIDARLAYFLDLTGFLGVTLALDGCEIRFVASIPVRGGQGDIPVVVTHPGRLDGKTSTTKVLRSTNWQRSVIGNPSVFAGGEDLPDEHVMSYGSLNDGWFIPQKVGNVGQCVLCGSAPVTLEHCVPKWLSDHLGVMPVTAEILCPQCNNELGTALEHPVSRWFLAGKELEPKTDDLARLWLFKTALLLSSASNARYSAEYREALRINHVPSKVRVLKFDASRVANGFAYTVTHFRRKLVRDGYLLVTIYFSGKAYVIVHPDPFPLKRHYVAIHHDDLLWELTGVTMQRTRADLRFQSHTRGS